MTPLLFKTLPFISWVGEWWFIQKEICIIHMNTLGRSYKEVINKSGFYVHFGRCQVYFKEGVKFPCNGQVIAKRIMKATLARYSTEARNFSTQNQNIIRTHLFILFPNLPKYSWRVSQRI